MLPVLFLAACALLGCTPGAGAFVKEKSGGDGEVKTIPLTRRDPGFFDAERGEVKWAAVQRAVEGLEGKYARNAAILEAKRTGNTSALLHKRATVALRYDGQSLWSGPILLGTPPQPFTVYFDTTSSDLLLPAYTCNSDLCNKRRKYDWRKSDTAREVEGKEEVGSYWTEGTIGRGRIIKDTITVSGLTVTSQDILALSIYPSLPSLQSTDGVFGLAYRPLSAALSYSFPFTLAQQISQGAYPEISPNTAGWFALRLSPTKGQSSVTFGGYNRGKVGGQMRWLPVSIGQEDVFRTYWQIGGSAFFLNRKQATDRGLFLFDSGSSLLVAPLDFAADFWSKVNGAREEKDSGREGYWSYPCDNPPNVSISFARITLQTYAIHPDDFNLGPLPPSSTSPSTEEGDPEQQQRCLGALVARNLAPSLGPNTVVVGEPFFRSWYVAFDAKNNRIGLAPPRVR